MPELPEVETTCSGIRPLLQGQRIAGVIVRQRRLRQPIPARLPQQMRGATITAIERRAKYILLRTTAGTALLHLGMSGSLRLTTAAEKPTAHDHVDIVLTNGSVLRLRDPRRFGLLLWTQRDPLEHRLLQGLGPEPLEAGFTAEVLWQQAQRRRVAVKQLTMDGHVVVGVGNIYASEALFGAGIDPRRQAATLTRNECRRLVTAIRKVLQAAIRQGGTTLRDFTASDGRPGYFRQHLKVYGRGGEPCTRCHTPIATLRQGQRASYYCPHCQQ
ncbi:MAG: bifunctional DNA-formamidopyrimidine glycosylase/DNA-(apurinic or apyrimidinic site) lyase [Gammaproteobacteria bacterium]|nr:bifunctional DNA-formamidopyrimidine glycosylase/DNA-(apurinic or apyrimidinic site) lyase [Gammaproteobacteria bacterium]